MLGSLLRTVGWVVHRNVQTSLMAEGHVLQHQNQLFLIWFYIKAVELMHYLKKNILNFSQIPEAQFNSIPLLSQFSKGASAQLVMFQMKAAAKTPQSQAPSFILQFSPCLFKHRRQKGKRIIIYNWDLTFFFVDLLSSNLNYVCISLWLFVLL